MVWFRRIFLLLLRAYPRRFREQRGFDMWLTFEDHLRDARSQGFLAVLSLWQREFIAVWRGGRLARISAHAADQAHRHRNPSNGRRSVLGISSLDFRLALRMLIKYPGLSIVSIAGMAVAIAIGAGSFGVIYSMMDPTLPLDEGDRVIAIQNWDARIGNPNRQALHDFTEWRGELETVVDLGAYRTTTHNLIATDGGVDPVRIAEMTASGFRVARVQPALGRYLVDEDERADAPAVVVIGYDVWQSRFAGDPDIVSRTLQLDNDIYTVVGVMPPEFAFPVNYHFWTPLQLNPVDWDRGRGPSITMFGRLAPGSTFEDARAELRAIGQRNAAAFPETHEQLQPHVLPYTYPFFDVDTPETALAWHFLQLVITMLLVVVGVNVAILVYARTATRMGEIAVRSALGASRGRIITQLFVEALVLSGVAAIVGIGLAAYALAKINALIEQVAGSQFPFWLNFNLSFGTVIYVSLLAVFAAAIVGIIPAAKITGPRVQSNLQRLTSTGVRMQLGRTWTVLIVAQVAVAVAVLPAAVFYGRESITNGTEDPGFAAAEFLGAWLSMERETPPQAEAESYRKEFEARFGERHIELNRRIENEPAVSDLTFALSRVGEERRVWVEIEGLSTPGETPGLAVRWGSAGHEVRFNKVSVNYFDTFDVPILTGRGFTLADGDTTSTAAIVNRVFVDSYLGGGNAIGRRVRYVGISGDADPNNVELERWYDIVGVVPDFPQALTGGLPKLYTPVSVGELYPVSLAVRVRGTDAVAFAPRLRAVAAAVDPTIRLNEVLPLSDEFEQARQFILLSAIAICLVTASVLLLSAAGIYSLMSFTVTQRRREIGIRTALGADRRNILIGIFRRAIIQLAIGVTVGAFLAQLLDLGTGGELMNGEGMTLLPIVAAVMMVVGLLAAITPARRGLEIQPTEALREET